MTFTPNKPAQAVKTVTTPAELPSPEELLAKAKEAHAGDLAALQAELEAAKKEAADARAAAQASGAPVKRVSKYPTYRLPSTPSSYIFANGRVVQCPDGIITANNEQEAAELAATAQCGNIWEDGGAPLNSFQDTPPPVGALVPSTAE